MTQNEDRNRSTRDTGIVDPAAATPARASAAANSMPDMDDDTVGGVGGTVQDDGQASVTLEQTDGGDGDTLPPPRGHRADTMVRAVAANARKEMEGDGTFGNQSNFTKGDNAPTADQSSYPYTVEQMDEILTEAPRGLFPDTPGGDGATPLSADRNRFLSMMGDRGRFPSQRETEKWARAVFNAMRQRAIEKDDAMASEFADVVRVGEAPEVQVEEMMWGGDFVERMSRALAVTSTWTKAELYEQVAEEAGATTDDPWVDAAVFSFFGTLKEMQSEVQAPPQLGELQEIWDRA